MPPPPMLLLNRILRMSMELLAMLPRALSAFVPENRFMFPIFCECCLRQFGVAHANRAPHKVAGCVHFMWTCVLLEMYCWYGVCFSSDNYDGAVVVNFLFQNGW